MSRYISTFNERIDVIFDIKIRQMIFSTVLRYVYLYYFYCCDNQLLSGFAMSRALLYAISNVKQV